MLAFAAATLVEALLLIGNWEEAESVYQAAMNEDGLDGDPIVAYAGVVIRALQGDDRGATTILATVEKWDGSEDPQDRSCLSTSRAMTALCVGDPEAALDHARSGLKNYHATGLIAARWVWPTATAAAFELGDLAAVDDLLDWLDQFPIGHTPPPLRAHRTRIEAKVQSVAGAADATARFETAVRMMRDVGVPHFLAETLLDAADHLASNGESKVAQTYADEAQVIATRVGSRPLLDRASRFAAQSADSSVEAAATHIDMSTAH